MHVLAYITDLFFQSKVGETAKQSGVKLKIVGSIYKLLPELSKKPSLVLIDLEAEGISGPALISQIKGSYPDLPVVAFGTHVKETLLAHARSSGADEVLPRSKFSKELASIFEKYSSSD